MTEKDLRLIAKARNTPYWDWMDIEPMRSEADTEECSEILHYIAGSKYHTDEYYGI